MQFNQFHVHFGVGKIFLGLLLESIIQSNYTLLCFQRESKDLKKLLKKRK